MQHDLILLCRPCANHCHDPGESCCTAQSYDTGEYDKLVAKYEKLNWRMISKPGGATVKPDDFYSLYGCAAQRLMFMSMFLPARKAAAAVLTVGLHTQAVCFCSVMHSAARSGGSAAT